MDCSPPGSSVHGILQAKILEWVAIPFSRGFFPTQGWSSSLLYCRQIIHHLSHLGSPIINIINNESSKQCQGKKALQAGRGVKKHQTVVKEKLSCSQITLKRAIAGIRMEVTMEGEKGANLEHVIQNVYIAEIWQ